MKDRDLSTILSELVEAGVARWGSVTFVVPGEGQLTVDAEGVNGLVDEIKGAASPAEGQSAPTPLTVRPLRTA